MLKAMNRKRTDYLYTGLLLFLSCAITLHAAALPIGIAEEALTARGVDVPILVSPADGSTHLPIHPFPVHLDWEPIAGALEYEIHVARDENFTQIARDEIAFFSDINIHQLTANTQYFWRVRVPGDSWSEVWDFTMSVLPAPLLQSPPVNATGVSTDPLLVWFEDPAVWWHDIQVATQSDFSPGSLVVDEEEPFGGQVSFQVTGLQENTQYWWRVRGEDPGLGDPSDWSETWTFTTEGLAPVILNWPSDGAFDVAINTTFDWSPTPEAATYDMQVATSSSFSAGSLEIDINTPNDSYPATLDETTQYWWRARAVTGSGELGPWSQEWSFSTETLPTPKPVPVLDAPANGAEVSVTPTFEWHDQAGAPTVISYKLQIATNANFNTIVYQNGQLAGNSSSFTLPQQNALNVGATYHWRMKARYSTGNSAWSASRSFTTVQDLCWFSEGGYLRFDDGSVNIGGGADPSYRFTVSGTVASRGLTLTVNGWPDFVFEPDYALMPLEEVARFIETHGHLPGIPSAAEVQARGLALGEMQSKLLQKIEELTLYLIDFARADGALASMPELEAVAHYIEEHGHLPGVPDADVVSTQGIEVGSFLNVLQGKTLGLLRPLRQLAQRRGLAVEQRLPHPIVRQPNTRSSTESHPVWPARSVHEDVASTSSCSNNADDFWMVGESVNPPPEISVGALNNGDGPVSFGPPTSAAQGATLVVNGTMGVEEMVITNSSFTEEGFSVQQWSLSNGVMQVLNGQVAIGGPEMHNSASELLTVHGTVAAKELVISEVSWPDYVFEPHYPLRPLAEVAYEAEVHNTWLGLEADLEARHLGERTASLLEQIEQLTLYLLALKAP